MKLDSIAAAFLYIGGIVQPNQGKHAQRRQMGKLIIGLEKIIPVKRKIISGIIQILPEMFCTIWFIATVETGFIPSHVGFIPYPVRFILFSK